ncbi:MAG: DNA repair protein RecO [Planctomycetota bacterium]
MPSTTHDALCVRLWDWSETSQTVSLLTRDAGLIRCVAKGAKRDKSPFSGGLELCTRGEAELIIKTTGAMSTLTAWDLVEPYPGLRRSLSAFRMSAYGVDLARHLVPEGEAHPDLFDALAALLRGLGSASSEEQPGHLLRFQWDALSDAGYQPGLPPPGEVQRGYVLDPMVGRFVPDKGRHPDWRVRRSTVETLRFVASAGTPLETPAIEGILRASRLLAAYAAHLLGGRLFSERGLFLEQP